MKQLPKYFVIKNPGNTELWKKYINWLNKKYTQHWTGESKSAYYGYDGNISRPYNGTDYYLDLNLFENNPRVLTLEEWDDIVNSKEKPSYTIQDLAEGRCMVINDGTYKELQTVLKAAHSNTEPFYGKYNTKYFWTSNNVFWKNTNQGDKNLPAQSVKEFLKQLNMIDYKIKGTKLPTIPAGTNYRIISWFSSLPDEKLLLEYKDFVSFGGVVYNNEIYILAEREDYESKFFYMIKESDILKLINIKNMKKEIIGYKAPMDLFDGNVKKGNIFTKNGTINYKCNNLLLPKEIVEQWEPVYKSQEKIINIGFDVKVTSEGIFHKTDNITEFVDEMCNMFTKTFTYTFGCYKTKIKDIVWESTGCQNVETKLSDWKKVWETYQEMSK